MLRGNIVYWSSPIIVNNIVTLDCLHSIITPDFGLIQAPQNCCIFFSANMNNS